MIKNEKYLGDDSFAKELLNMFPNVIISTFSWIKDDRITAYEPNKNHILLAAHVPSISHEIAHMVEMNKFSRLVQDDWGLPNSNLLDCKSSFLFAALARETRVRAIESFLNGRKEFNNNYWFNVANTHLPFGKFKVLFDIQYWVEDMWERTIKIWSKDRIYTEWVKRVEYIRNWQESNE